MNGRIPIQILRPSERLINGQMLAVMHRLQSEERVAHVGNFVRGKPVTETAVEGRIHLPLFAKVMLRTRQKSPGLSQNGIVLRIVGAQKRHHADRGVICGEIRQTNTAIRFGVA